MDGNLCRCTGYQPILNACKVLSQALILSTKMCLIYKSISSGCGQIAAYRACQHTMNWTALLFHAFPVAMCFRQRFARVSHSVFLITGEGRRDFETKLAQLCKASLLWEPDLKSRCALAGRCWDGRPLLAKTSDPTLPTKTEGVRPGEPS